MDATKGVSGESTSHNKSGKPNHQHPPPSTSDLMSSAKLIAGAAKSAMSHESDKIDKGKVAGAAADMLGAAKHYGKFEEKSFGKYFDKAEGYLHNYNTSHSTTATPPSAPSSTTANPHASSQYASSHSSSHHETSHSSSSGGGSGYGDYIKLAQGLLKKH